MEETVERAESLAFGMVMQQSTLSLEESRIGKDAADLIDLVVDLFC
jgi:hypothetical protein